ncbi:MAG: hypothetical protein JO246_05505, partial [Frankiaceae bacterium]|nr:hypothetical protein [Frankiaceae bacterium]
QVPESAVIGKLDGGWRVAMSSLEHERDMIWIMNWVEIERGLQAVARHSADLDDGLLAALGRRLADAAALRATGFRGLEDTLANRAAPQATILKLLGSEALQHTWELAATAAGAEAIVDPGLSFERHDALAATIYGGTSDVQRNIIGERVLGLPRV